MKNLWKDLESLKSDVQNPVDLIKEQAEYLETGTDGLLILSTNSFSRLGVISKKVMNDQNFKIEFKYQVSLKTEYLPEYKYNIFFIYYDITFYPLILNVPFEIADEINKEDEFHKIESTESRIFFKIEDEDEFEQIMEAIFNSNILRTVMANLKMIIDIDTENES